MTTNDNARTLLDAGAASVEPEQFIAAEAGTPDLIAAVVPAGYMLATKDIEAEIGHLRAAPRRVRGDVTVTDTASWLAYFGKHDGGHSEVFGDVRNSIVTAILNAPAGPDAPAWGDHRVSLRLQHSAAWVAWKQRSGQWFGQEDFAEHLEDRTPDLIEPDAATMLELAQTFKATKGVQFESSSSLSSGERRFQYLETVDGKAGKRGDLVVPPQIKIQVQVWRGVAIVVPLTARFRFRVEREGLKLSFVLDRLDDVLDAAWSSLLGELTEALPVPVLAGTAPQYGG